MDEMNMNNALVPVEDAALVPVESADDSLILRFYKPYTFEGAIYEEVDLSGFEMVNGNDMVAVEKYLLRKGTISPGSTMNMTLVYTQHMAARVSHKPVEFFTRLPAREQAKLQNMWTGFLYGGGSEN